MIVYHKNNEIDREQWDNCIKNTPGSKPYAYSWYLDIMAPGWHALVDDDYDSVFPVPGFNRFGIQYVATPVFLQQLGAFSPDKPASQVINEFLDFMPDFYKFIDLCVGQKIDAKGYKVTEKINFELDLSKPYETIFNSFSDHCRRNVEASVKKNPILISDISPDEIIDLFIQNKGKDIRGIKVISRVMELYRSKCTGRSPFDVLVRANNPGQAGSIGFVDGNLAFNVKAGAYSSNLGAVI